MIINLLKMIKDFQSYTLENKKGKVVLIINKTILIGVRIRSIEFMIAKLLN